MNIFEKTLLEEANTIKQQQPVKSEGSVRWESPSNIAIVKYWGKYPGQIPANASVSITLSEAVSRTTIDYKLTSEEDGTALQFFFDGKAAPTFASRIEKYLDNITLFLPWLNHTSLVVRSENTFPHSSGIASSASAMSALSLGLCTIEKELYGKEITEDFRKKASFLARLGSGSASRSVYGRIAVWGSTSSCPGSSDEYAIPVEDIHPDFRGMKDSILIIESGKKKVSSSVGHDLMKTNPYSRLRFDVAEENMHRLCAILRNGDAGQFIDTVENEALSLHAMMMTSQPGYILMKPNTIEAIQRIRDERKNTGLPMGFTLDAGANVHILYPEKHATKARSFIESALLPLCENGQVIHDQMGNGPVHLKN